MKSFSIVAIAAFALIASCASVPIVNQPVNSEIQARVDALTFIYENLLQDLFSGLVTNTFSTLSNALNNLIQTNPLGIGKRDLQEDLTARADALTFLYENLLQELFSGLVTNTFGTISNALNNLIQTNPLGIGKRDLQGDELAARADVLTFIYENLLQDLFSGLVTNTFNTLSGALNNLIQTNPLGIGKRDLQGDLAARVDILSFLYDNILQDFFSGLVTNTFSTLSGALNNLISTNPLGVGKRSVNLQQIEAILNSVAPTLVQQLKSYIHQAIALWNDRNQLAQLAQTVITQIKATVANLVQQLAQVIPSTLINEASQLLAAVQSMLIFWTSGLAGSLGPVLGPFRP